MATKAGTLTASTTAIEQQERETIFDIFRRWGYLQASLDPLGQYLPPQLLLRNYRRGVHAHSQQ
jgi:2-oxoglutarate dehydrogenase E1 component